MYYAVIGDAEKAEEKMAVLQEEHYQTCANFYDNKRAKYDKAHIWNIKEVEAE
jgi:hypothetical protein